ncbi:protein translocase subunit SecD [Alteromonas sediminis]|uniref:Protein translocase subunit SecD n=1 Tax=Alteromonas sediminis TaxID=2259342 RepID=A0A3N5YMA4_9ALTE|nr:protein translocase subunit SecD [Alteromonas sediminis]RPJ66451.1 protein translocase subunit SecD [Alteromonas sediminis]
MKKQTTLMPGIWQRLMIFSVLLFLIFNSLPSFLGQYDALTLRGMPLLEAQRHSLTLEEILRHSNNHHIMVTDNGKSDRDSEVTLVFTDTNADMQQLLRQLKEDFADTVEVTLGQVSKAPPMLTSIAAQPMKLGLDLSGGALFVLEVDTDTALAERVKKLQQLLNVQIRQDRLIGSRVSKLDDGSLLVTFSESRSAQVSSTLDHFVAKNEGLQVLTKEPTSARLGYSEEKRNALSKQYREQALTTIRGRIEQLGITEGVIQKQGKDRIRIEIPGIKDLEQAERLIGATASVSFHQLALNGDDPRRLVIDDKQYGRQVLSAKPIFTGAQINDAQMGRDEQGIPLVNLVLNSQGGKSMSDFSKANIGKPMATLFTEYVSNEQGDLEKSERLISVATIQAQLGNRFSITNLQSATQAHDLALLLRAGSLDAPVSIVEKRIINASLGDKNVKNGMLALAIGLLFTLVFMVLIYRRLGLVANMALILNLACLTGLMALTPNAVLTLPGIAGLVLTVGMAVDTNVLIFERIRFEQQRGAPPRLAMILGYKHAWSTILDANLTTLICALVMLSIGYGPVKGFAITLTLGLLTSVFTGVALSKTLSAYFSADWLLNNKGVKD